MPQSTTTLQASVFGPLYVEISAERPEFTTRDDDSTLREAAKLFIGLIHRGGSLLTDHDVWTDENIQELIDRYVSQPDVSGAGYFEKLNLQLEGAPADVWVLLAEITLLQVMPLYFQADTKISHVDRMLADKGIRYEIPAIVLEAFEHPAYRPGPAASVRRYWQLCVLINFVKYFRSCSEADQTLAIHDPLKWRALVNDAPGTPEPTLRGSLTYLGHPDYFISIVSQKHKEDIVSAFYPEVTGIPATGDLDVDLASIQQWLNPRPDGNIIDLYHGPLRDLWQTPDTPDEVADPVDVTDTEKLYDVESILAEGSFHSAQALRRIIDRWQDTRNIVLQGPPGTGKSWLGRRLAYALIGSRMPEAVRSVQFHPGTSYEDFVRGWRPGSDGRLQLANGPLLQHAERARKNEDIPHVLLIEEFNRGNPAQALGEMLTLLEATKRDQAEALELTYMNEGEEPFWLPDNLYVIGTMNTADRSLALVDFALRRRFAFFDLEPQFNAAWLTHLRAHFQELDAATAAGVRDRIVALNEQIAADPTLGPSFRIGHSYFTATRQHRDFASWMQSVIDTSIRPQLAEYWHDSPQEVDEIVGRLRGEL